MDSEAVDLGRRYIADIAWQEGECIFAHEVLQGMWDHRRDVSSAIERAKSVISAEAPKEPAQ